MPNHTTPDDIDYLFDRDYIDEADYIDFWRSYWKRDEAGRERLVESVLKKVGERERQFESRGQFGLPLRGTVTRNRETAEKQAKAIGGRVARRDRFGRFNSRGRSYQAIKHAKQTVRQRTKRK